MADVRQGREGNRWVNQRPSAREVADWFKTVRLHEGMEHEHYVGGVTLIQTKEKSEEVLGFDNQGRPNIGEREDLVYVPYVKVDTRIRYFWDYVELHAGRWIASIDPVNPQGGEGLGLPPGFFKYSAKEPGDKIVSFVGCSYRVVIRETMVGTTEHGRPIFEPAIGSKIVATANKWRVDQNAVMKAETGAIGRALGMAGMLVIPGSGVATAEDMQEELTSPPAGATADPALPPPTDDLPRQEQTVEQLRERADALVGELKSADEEAHKRFQAWARETKVTLADANTAQLKGVIKRLEKDLDAAAAKA